MLRGFEQQKRHIKSSLHLACGVLVLQWFLLAVSYALVLCLKLQVILPKQRAKILEKLWGCIHNTQ